MIIECSAELFLRSPVLKKKNPRILMAHLGNSEFEVYLVT